MLKYYLIISIIVLIEFDLNSQTIYPILQDSITYCRFCDNDYVVDRVWDDFIDIYTEIAIDELSYKIYRLTDTTYHLRKYKNEKIVEKGTILLKKNAIMFGDTSTCYDCVTAKPWAEMILVQNFARPTRIGSWEIIGKNGIIITGTYKEEEFIIEN